MKIEFIFGLVIGFFIGILFLVIFMNVTDCLYVDGAADAIKHPEQFRTEYNITTAVCGDTIRVDTIVSMIK